MRIKLVENDIGSNRISFKQNASGFWYINELTINCVSVIDGIELSKVAIDKVILILEEKNNVKVKEWMKIRKTSLRLMINSLILF